MTQSSSLHRASMNPVNRPQPLALHRISPVLVVALFSLCPTASGQAESTFGTIVEGKLIIGLLDKSPQVVERSDIAKLPHKTVKVKASDSKTAVYSGVPLKELLEHVGVVFSPQQQQRNLGSVVLVESVDSPSALFAMAELDTAVTDKRVLLADGKDGKDGKPLIAPEGPFRIIVPDEKEPVRWAKHVWAIYVVRISEPSKRP